MRKAESVPCSITVLKRMTHPSSSSTDMPVLSFSDVDVAPGVRRCLLRTKGRVPVIGAG